MKKSAEQSKIDRLLRDRKKWLIEYEPVCIFCGGFCKEDLCHKIRRSYASSRYPRVVIQTLSSNTGLGHRYCHDIFDNDIEGRRLLPLFKEVMQDIKEIDPEYFALMRK
jgi:hypothetical protein